MSNQRKSFSFRNGIQIDDNNFVVNPNGLVGIGTTIPEQLLDVRGTVQVVGLVTSNNISVKNNLTSGVINSGITSIKSGIITATSGVVTYYGDGGRLLNLPTSQWVDINAGLGFTSIYAQGNVGVATNDPRYTFQVGGNNNLSSFQNGVGIDSTGNIKATGIITASTISSNTVTSNTVTSSNFSGTGQNITSINASNISSGTLSNDRLPVIDNSKIPNNFQVTGIITALGSFRGNLVGIATTARDLTSDARVSISHITASTSNIGISTVSTRLTSASIGVGTESPSSTIHVVGSSDASVHVTAATESTITLGRSLSRTGNAAGLRFGNTSGIYEYSTTKTLDIINYDTGNLNYYLHYGAAGVGTGNFNWIYAPDPSNPRMTLTYDGKLGIGKTDPDENLDVLGTIQSSILNVTGSFFNVGAGSTTTVKTIYIQNAKAGILDGDGVRIFPETGENFNITAGISTLYDLQVLNKGSFNSVGIGTNNPLASLQVGSTVGGVENLILIDSGIVGIGTDQLISVDASLYCLGGDALFGGVGIGTTTVGDANILNVIGNSIFNGNVNITGILTDRIGNVRNYPQNSQSTSGSAYTLTSTDVGKHVLITNTTNGIIVPDNVFSVGQYIVLVNNTTNTCSIDDSGGPATAVIRIAGDSSTTLPHTLNAYGVATLLCVASNTFVLYGQGVVN